jgi:hypothetical protein
MENNNSLVPLLQSSGLEEKKQNQIAETLGTFFNKASEWDATIQSIVITDPSEVGKMKMAREGRLTLKNMRLEAEKVVKGKRDEVKFRMANDVLEDKLWLKAGQMMEATFKNLETKLEEKELFAVRWEAELKEKRKATRIELLQPYNVDPQFVDLLNMDDTAFETYLAGVKAVHEAKIEAEKKAEAERIAKEKAIALHEERKEKILPFWNFVPADKKDMDFSELTEKEWDERFDYSRKEKEKYDAEQARIKAENEKLKKEAETKEKQLAEERAKAEAERKANEARIAKERAEADAKLEAQRKANEKLQNEIKAKAEAEAKAKKEADAKAEAELKAKQKAEADALKAPIKQRLNNWMNELSLESPAGMNEHATVIEILTKFQGFKDWAKKEIEKL